MFTSKVLSRIFKVALPKHLTLQGAGLVFEFVFKDFLMELYDFILNKIN